MNVDVNTKTDVSKTTAVNVALQLLLSLIFTYLLITEGEAHRSLSISLSTINYVSLLLSLACTFPWQNELTSTEEGSSQ